MVIISTRPVAEIIQAVSAASIFGGGALRASAGEAATAQRWRPRAPSATSAR